tara:strand:- start:1611 stop:1751 length:141 start_codon:yes stop_codon:yes gene_type:complete
MESMRDDSLAAIREKHGNPADESLGLTLDQNEYEKSLIKDELKNND